MSGTSHPPEQSPTPCFILSLLSLFLRSVMPCNDHRPLSFQFPFSVCFSRSVFWRERGTPSQSTASGGPHNRTSTTCQGLAGLPPPPVKGSLSPAGQRALQLEHQVLESASQDHFQHWPPQTEICTQTQRWRVACQKLAGARVPEIPVRKEGWQEP